MFTNKKQKFVGVRTLVDSDTGEVFPVQFSYIEDRDFNFHKMWLRNFIDSMDDISNQKLRLAFWIIDHLDTNNKLTMTQRCISEKSGISLKTVNMAIKSLQKSNPPFLVKINSGAYQVNPDIIFKGAHGNRMGVCYQYTDHLRDNESD